MVLAASYEAKAFGVQGGMSGRRARQLCPDLEFVGGHFREYQRLADQVMDVFHDFTPAVERISIDEAFLDVTGSTHLFGSPRTIAELIRTRVRAEIGLPVSVGAASTKHLAKVASQVAKPDGIVVVEPGCERAFLEPLPVGLLWGVGPVTRERLAAAGITTIGQLADASPDVLQRLLGKAIGEKLGAFAANIDPRQLHPGRRALSVGAQSALGRQPASAEVVRRALWHLADRVAPRLRTARRAGRTITARVRFVDLRSVTRSTTLRTPTCTTNTIAEVATALAMGALTDHPAEREISLVAVGVSNLVDAATLQLELPLRAGETPAAARLAIDSAVDGVRARFGRTSIGWATVALRPGGGVPDEFRELAEHDP